MEVSVFRGKADTLRQRRDGGLLNVLIINADILF